LWFVESYVDKIGRITPAGAVTEFAAGITHPAMPAGITAGPDGNLWFTESLGNRIGRITPAGVVTEFSNGLTSGGFDPFTGKPNGPEPTSITTGPDGNLWFSEPGPNRVARITPAGVVTEFPVGTGSTQPGGITTGPDGNVWFTEPPPLRIGRLQ
jgi:streptogramin lyase